MKLEFYRQIFEKISNNKFYKNPSVLKRNLGGDFVIPNYLPLGGSLYNTNQLLLVLLLLLLLLTSSLVTGLFFLVLLLNQR
jgi:hypothetical protein